MPAYPQVLNVSLLSSGPFFSLLPSLPSAPHSTSFLTDVFLPFPPVPERWHGAVERPRALESSKPGFESDL